jgi:hypothetical protein
MSFKGGQQATDLGKAIIIYLRYRIAHPNLPAPLLTPEQLLDAGVRPVKVMVSLSAHCLVLLLCVLPLRHLTL